MIFFCGQIVVMDDCEAFQHGATGKILVKKEGSLLQLPRIMFRHKELFQTISSPFTFKHES